MLNSSVNMYTSFHLDAGECTDLEDGSQGKYCKCNASLGYKGPNCQTIGK